MSLKKQFINKHQTVSALQRNFETLSKLVVEEQLAKEGLLVQNRQASDRIQEQAGRLVDYSDKITKLEAEIA